LSQMNPIHKLQPIYSFKVNVNTILPFTHRFS
jgi:hypothetical protein